MKYFVVDAFTDAPYQGNPAAVIIYDKNKFVDDIWLQNIANEFNLSETCFLIDYTHWLYFCNQMSPTNMLILVTEDRFYLRWFSPTVEVDLCGHGTLASAHTLFSNGFVNSDVIEFVTRSGVLTAKRVTENIELDLPVILTSDYNSSDISMFSRALNGAAIVDVRGTTSDNIILDTFFSGASKASSTEKIIVVLPSWESVIQVQPNMDEMLNCPGQIIIVTAAAPKSSTYDFCSRVFSPKLGNGEDPVCGSAHCALAHYWSQKLNKLDFLAYGASSRSGTIKITYDIQRGRVLLTSKAVSVLEGTILF